MALWFFSLLFFLFCSNSWAEPIPSLPGQQKNVTFNQYSGYIVTDASHGRALFYYFVEAESSTDELKPLTLWLNGGPGCSSLGFGAFMENGPFEPGEDGTLIKNPYSWNLESHMLYVESPIGVGFSYSNTSQDYILWNDTQTAQDNLVFILNWLDEFPQFKDCDFFLTGESYAGHYIPQLAALLVEHNKKPNVEPVNLKSIALGNPLLDIDISVLAGDFLWSHGAISDETLFLEKTVCNDSKFLREYAHNQWSQGCNDVFNRVADEVGVDVGVGLGDLLLPKCTSSSKAEQFRFKGKLGKIHEAVDKRAKIGDPCLDRRIFTYLNKPEVQKALHANTTHLPFHWDFCLGPLVYQEANLDMNIIPVVSDLINEGIPVLLYNGDQDAKIPLTQTRIIATNIAKDLNLIPLTDYGPWFDQKQVGGWTQSFGAPARDGKNVTYLTFATVRGAAHEVPFTSPSQALTMFQSFVTGTPLPRPSL
ncbi:serine carboxypeptidase-like 46 [Durio zibethinus]|uniref:Carboxypeptidase n=1 Tax=Durio zibethinus TaxID=66656 RepID=A0A6P5YMY4_DURZI|nr:serine carboxypeptidase-like 46 [Durio zibethinus]